MCPIFVQFKNLTISGGDRGIHMHYQGTMGQIDNCIIENNQKDGIAVWTAAAIDIENSIVRNNGLNGWGNGLSIWDAYAGFPIVKLKIMLMETELVFGVIQQVGLKKMK